MKVGKVTYDEAYKAVSEYKNKYPSKAITYYAQNYPQMAWAVFMAGGSGASIPVKDKSFLKAASQMKPIVSDNENYQIMVNSDIGCIIYSHSKSIIPISLKTGKYRLYYINPESGDISIIYKQLNIKGEYELDTSLHPNGVYWLSKLK